VCAGDALLKAGVVVGEGANDAFLSLLHAGIVGKMTLRYDIWGPDVLVANLMESNGVPGRITLSEKTVEALQGVPGVQFQSLGVADVSCSLVAGDTISQETWLPGVVFELCPSPKVCAVLLWQTKGAGQVKTYLVELEDSISALMGYVRGTPTRARSHFSMLSRVLKMTQK
jgi:hypothetical protein